MRVLHVNVRLHEGGAARIALDLHCRLLNGGVESRIAYGWGERGGVSSIEDSIPNSFQVGHKFQVASNLLLHRLVGVDFVEPLGVGRKYFRESIQWADVVHLHVTHSYFLPLTWLVRELVCAGKPVVWTAHDYWILTGRCAFTEGCEGWSNGCGQCPSQKNYPPAYLDFSLSQFKSKRKLLAELAPLLHVVAPTEFVAHAIRKGLPNAKVRVIPNWLDNEFVEGLRNVHLGSTPIDLSSDLIKVIIVANDLSDATKVDRKLVDELVNMPHVELHTVGQNSPFVGSAIFNHGKISNRGLMVEKVSIADVALFTSKKDTFGLVMIEALACGIPVLAVESLAAKEVLSILGIQPLKSINDISECVKNSHLPQCYIHKTKATLSEKVLTEFGGAIAVRRYTALYKHAMSAGGY